MKKKSSRSVLKYLWIRVSQAHLGPDVIAARRQNVIYLGRPNATDVRSLAEHYASVVTRLRDSDFPTIPQEFEPAAATMPGRRLQIFPLSSSGCLNQSGESHNRE